MYTHTSSLTHTLTTTIRRTHCFQICFLKVYSLFTIILPHTHLYPPPTFTHTNTTETHTVHILSVCCVCVFVGQYVCMQQCVRLSIHTHTRSHIHRYNRVAHATAPLIHTHAHALQHTQIQLTRTRYYGVASVSRINKIVGLFCKRDL